jgi:cytochrome c peroxidase
VQRRRAPLVGEVGRSIPPLWAAKPRLVTGFGNGTFNTPPLVKAADTGPFFHNNAVETIEKAVNFYHSGAFNRSPAGPFLGGISLRRGEVRAIAEEETARGLMVETGG